MESLARFAPITLADLASVALLDRIDTKYVLAVAQLSDVLPTLRPAYRILEIDGRRQSDYRTLYFDTPDFALYRSHQDGRRIRYKVRSRQYVGTPLAFFEVKHKTGPNHTRKERLPTPELVTTVTEPVSTFLHERIPLSPDALEAKLWVDYTRITLVERQMQERLTIDFDLRFSFAGEMVALPGLVIAELKSAGRPRGSFFAQLMRQHLIRPGSFSKYCIGASLRYSDLKHNRFSRILRRIDALQERTH
jgi:hypothetical protein